MVGQVDGKRYKKAENRAFQYPYILSDYQGVTISDRNKKSA
ncbi:hypothetical protein ACE41I_17285 [Bacillus cereus]